MEEEIIYNSGVTFKIWDREIELLAVTYSTIREVEPVWDEVQQKFTFERNKDRNITGAISAKLKDRNPILALAQEVYGPDVMTVYADDIPEFTIEIILNDNNGYKASMRIEDVVINKESSGFNIDDLSTSIFYSYIATEIIPLAPLLERYK
jgi:hypothetical protein